MPGTIEPSKEKRHCGADDCNEQLVGTSIGHHYRSRTDFEKLKVLRSLWWKGCVQLRRGRSSSTRETSSLRPFGPALGPSGLLDFVLRALRALRPCDPRMHVSVILIVYDACIHDACIHDACIHDACIHDACIHDA